MSKRKKNESPTLLSEVLRLPFQAAEASERIIIRQLMEKLTTPQGHRDFKKVEEFFLTDSRAKIYLDEMRLAPGNHDIEFIPKEENEPIQLWDFKFIEPANCLRAKDNNLNERWEFKLGELAECLVPQGRREECIGDYRETLRIIWKKVWPRWLECTMAILKLCLIGLGLLKIKLSDFALPMKKRRM